MLVHSPHEVVGRLRQTMHSSFERILPKPRRVRLPRNSTALDILREATKCGAGFLGPSANETVAALRLLVPMDEASVIGRATKISQGYVPIFGHGWVSVGSPPRWQTEPVSGKSAPDLHWSRVSYLDTGIVGDHKVLWEFNRHQHLVTLAQAARYSGDSTWTSEIRHQLTNWIDCNPASRGVNWASSLEVAYRSISWCWTLLLLTESGVEAVFDEALAVKFLESVVSHGTHVSKYLSTWFSPNTHLTGEALGLVYLGTLFPTLREASDWRRVGSAILEQEVDRQVRPDGVYFEQATQYHRYTTEIYLHYLLLTRDSRCPASSQVEVAVNRLFDVLLALSRPDGTMALLGDDDGGRLLQLDERTPDNLTSLFAIGAVALGRSDLAHVGQRCDAALIWTLGPGAAGARDQLAMAHTAHPATASAFRDGGIFTIRDSWTGQSGHATISCGPHGSLSGGHAHADALSVDLFSSGGPLFVDPGTFSYDGDDRDRFRSAAAHNTLEFAGVSPSTPGTPFRWQSTTDGALDHWWHDFGVTWFQGHHDGYGRVREGVRHTRTVWHPVEGCWVIFDDVNDAHDLPVSVRWHAAPGLTATNARRWEKAAELHWRRTEEGKLATLLLGASSSGSIGMVDDEVSKQYGKKQPATTVCWTGAVSGPVRVTSVIIDWRAFPADALRLKGFDVVDEIVVALASVSTNPDLELPILDLRGAHSCLELGTLSVSAQATCYLPARGEIPARCASIGVRVLKVDAEPSSATSSAFDLGRWMVAERQGAIWTMHNGTVAESGS